MRNDWHDIGARLALLAAPFFALAVHSSALAGAGIITTTVTPLTNSVTYSSTATTVPPRPALVTFVGYTVTVTNGGGNTINNIVFTGAATVTDTDEKAVFSSAEGASCTTTNADHTAVQCTIGQLTAGRSFPTFALFFTAPAKDTATPLPNGDSAHCDTTDCVHFNGATIYAEGTGGVP